MISRIKNFIKGKKRIFYDLCKSNNLTLSYPDNQTEIEILKDIFCDREYADFFPFYKKATIIDIGAHYGYFSIFAKNNVDEDSKIFTIEPNKANFKQLEKNIFDCKISNISCYNYAIGDINGISRLYQGQKINHSIIENYPLADNNIESEEVEVRTLEELINELGLKHIDFIKMDCEGAEYSIFNSTPDSIFDKITTISMEFHDLKDKNFTAQDLISKLTENKFRIVKFHYEKTSMNLNYGKIIGTKI
ncbi:MAG: FkbM family methyltransferase [Prolixibacteraceae bacterium]|jgi:FkbM family methyltransferase|nr:FkbM family methyltransferase [Prolixibacteraceae bacterium]